MLIYKYILGTKEILKDMDTRQILVNQEKMVDIFRDNRWKNGMNIYQREKIITEFFYYNIFVFHYSSPFLYSNNISKLL